jgi:hypothetical protein
MQTLLAMECCLHVLFAPAETRLTQQCLYARNPRTFIITILSLYPHTPLCKPGRTLKQNIQQPVEFMECLRALDWGRVV